MNLPTLLLSLLMVLPTWAAITGGLRVNYDTTGTNTTGTRVTVSAQTNLNAGVVNATNSIAVGQLGQQGVLTLSSTNGTYAVTLSLDASGNLNVKYGTTNMLVLLNGSAATNDGSATKFLSAAGYFAPAVASGLTNININPTDNYLPYRSNATVFGNSPWRVMGTNAVAMVSSRVTNSITLLDDTIFYLMEEDGATLFQHLIDPNQHAFNLYEETGDAWLTIGVGANSSYMEMRNNASVGWRLNPSQIDNGATPYVFNGSIEHTTGDYIASTNATGGKVFAVAAVSGYAGGGTKALYDDGTYKFPLVEYGTAISDLTTALTTGVNKGIIRLPVAVTLTEVRCSLLTAQTGGSIFTVDILEGGVSVLSTPVTIDNGETTSESAAAPPVISDSSLADNASMTFSITQVGDGTAVGCQCWLIGRRQ
jgi:hypothetical protein